MREKGERVRVVTEGRIGVGGDFVLNGIDLNILSFLKIIKIL